MVLSRFGPRLPTEGPYINPALKRRTDQVPARGIFLVRRFGCVL